MKQTITLEQLASNLSEVSRLKDELANIAKRISLVMDGLPLQFFGNNETPVNIYNDFNNASRQSLEILGLYEDFLNETIKVVTEPTAPDALWSSKYI